MRPGRAGAPVPLPLLESIAALVEEYSGLALDQTQQRALQSAVAGRMEATASGDHAAYLALLRRQRSGEPQMLVEAVANAQTTFFRNAPHFRVLRERVLPVLLGARDRVLLWSAGCSTGEEAYSLAIACLEVGIPAARDVRILGTDISGSALATAERGEYPPRRVAHVEPSLRERYFEHTPRGWRVRNQVRSLVSWRQHNLMDAALPVPQESVDVLFCQNVTIYFRPATIRHVVERLATALREGGCFFPGFSETLWCRAPGLEMEGFGDCFVYRRERPVADTPHGGSAGTSPSRPEQAAKSAPRCQGSRRSISETSMPPTGEPGSRRAVPEAATPLGEGRTPCRAVSRDAVPLDEPPGCGTGGGEQADPAASASAARCLEEARASAAAGRVEDAWAAALRAADAEPMLADAWELLGLLNQQVGRTDEAERAFRRQLYLDPESPLPHFYLATLFRESGRPEEAAREYARAIKILEGIPPETLLAGVTADLMLSACRQYGAGNGARRDT